MAASSKHQRSPEMTAPASLASTPATVQAVEFIHSFIHFNHRIHHSATSTVPFTSETAAEGHRSLLVFHAALIARLGIMNDDLLVCPWDQLAMMDRLVGRACGSKLERNGGRALFWASVRVVGDTIIHSSKAWPYLCVAAGVQLSLPLLSGKRFAFDWLPVVVVLFPWSPTVCPLSVSCCMDFIIK